MKIDPKDPQHWLLLLRQLAYTLIGLCWRCLRGTPKKPLIILYGHQLSGNLKALYEEHQRQLEPELECYFLSLDPRYATALEQQEIKVLRCGKFTDMLRAMRCDAMITDHGLHAMLPLASLSNILLVDVWHGIPFKGFIAEDFRTQHKYNESWVSSPLLADLYTHQFGFASSMVKPLGYARVDKLFRRDPARPSFRNHGSVSEGTRIVLYAPTWKQDAQNRELFPFGETQESFILKLSNVCALHNAILVVRGHINGGIVQQSVNNVLYCSMKDFPDSESLLMETDVLICDWSSIAFDYLALDRPTIFLDVPPPFSNGFSLGPNYRYGSVVAAMSELSASLDGILKDPTQYRQEHNSKHRKICQEVYGENTDGLVARRQWQHLQQTIRPTK